MSRVKPMWLTVLAGTIAMPLRIGESGRMNQYGRQAMEHWRLHRPTVYRELTDPEAFFTRAGEEISLTATEFELLRFLMRNPRRVLSKAQILDRVWNYDFGGQANVVELYISYLRKKIDAGREPMIHTMRGAGYVLKPAAGV